MKPGLPKSVTMQVFNNDNFFKLGGYSIELNGGEGEDQVMFGVANEWEVRYKSGGIQDVWVSVKIELMAPYTKFTYDGPGGPHSYSTINIAYTTGQITFYAPDAPNSIKDLKIYNPEE